MAPHNMAMLAGREIFFFFCCFVSYMLGQVAPSCAYMTNFFSQMKLREEQGQDG